MLKIDDKNNITLTRGDTLTLELTLTKDGDTYTPESGDVIRFACASGYKGQTSYELMFDQTFPNDTLMVTIPAETTGELDYLTYHYDVEITHGDGTVDTVISANLTITGEVE